MICTVDQYRTITTDLDTEDYRVTAALVSAQSEAEQFCQRSFESATRTEVLRLYTNGRVYPKAFPIAAVIGMPGAIIDGWGVLLGYGYQYATGVNPFVSGFGSDTWAWQPQITVTYTGGYSPDTMPQEVVRAVAQVAYDELHPVVMAGVPAGASSVAVGDVSVSGAINTFTALRPGVRGVLTRYRRPQVVAF